MKLISLVPLSASVLMGHCTQTYKPVEHAVWSKDDASLCVDNRRREAATMELNRTHRARHVIFPSLVLGTAAILLLVGCSNPVDSATEVTVQQSQEALAEESAEAQTEGGMTDSVPDDFPSVVPLPDDPLTLAIEGDNDGRKSWVLSFESAQGSTFDELRDELMSSGFEEDHYTEMGDQARTWNGNGQGYVITLAVLGDDEDDRVLNFSVHESN